MNDTPTTATINLALQGGGAHGAFTAGVLDRLLEDDGIAMEGATGASAGAVNGVLLAYGLLKGGNDGAREMLNEFWDQVSTTSLFVRQGWGPLGAGFMGMEPATVATRAMLDMFRFTSPYQLNPFDLNPLRDLLDGMIDFDALRARSPVKLFLAATHVRTGKLRIFRDSGLTRDVLLASACLPHLHHAIEIDGEYYWDGAFSGNPPVYPLIHDCRQEDVLIVMLYPLERDRVPHGSREISERLVELSTNATFLREMGDIARRQQAALESRPGARDPEQRISRLKFHLIEAEEVLSSLEHPSRYNTDAAFISMLWQEGRRRADAWLRDNARHLGARSTVDLAAMFT